MESRSIFHQFIIPKQMEWKKRPTNLRRNLEDKRGAWLKELPKVLWAQRTTKKRAIDESPFALVYGADIVLLIEVEIPILESL